MESPQDSYFILMLALASYGSAIWGGLFFFKTDDPGAKQGRRLIGFCSITATVVALASISTAVPRPPLASSLAAGLYLVSLALFWLSIAEHRKAPLAFAFSSEKPDHFVISGTHKLIRHPFYTSYLLGWAAPVIYAESFAAAICFSIMLIIYWRSATLEESFFQLSAFSEEYAIYKRSTGMFFPRLLKKPGPIVGKIFKI